MNKFCCPEFEESATGNKPLVGGGFLYPKEAKPDAQFEKQEDGTWAINGCCGGGCYVASGIKFCPYCGTKLEP